MFKDTYKEGEHMQKMSSPEVHQAQDERRAWDNAPARQTVWTQPNPSLRIKFDIF